MENLSDLKQQPYKYVKLQDALKARIRDGVYVKGDRLPGEVALADQFSVSRVTARQAMEALKNEGLVIRRQGAGSFVQSIPEAPTQKMPPKIDKAAPPQNVAYVMIDRLLDESNYAPKLHAAQQVMSDHDIMLSIANLNSVDLMAGVIPTWFRPDRVDGVIFDGPVQEGHVRLAERLGIPYVVMGNCPLPQETVQVRYDCYSIAQEIVEYLGRLADQPIVLLVEPFRLHYTKEIYAGYVDAIRKRVGGVPLLHTCNDDGYRGIKYFLNESDGRFSLFTVDRMLGGVLKAYQEFGLTNETNPIMTFGNPRVLTERQRQMTHFAPMSAEILMRKTAQTLIAQLNGEPIDTCTQLREPILPPTTGPANVDSDAIK